MTSPPTSWTRTILAASLSGGGGTYLKPTPESQELTDALARSTTDVVPGHPDTSRHGIAISSRSTICYDRSDQSVDLT